MAKSYQPSYQSYAVLVGAVTVTYDAARTAATLTVRALHKNTSGAVSLTYVFNGTASASPSLSLTASADHGPLSVAIVASDGARVTLEPVDLLWDAPPVLPRTGDYRGGQKGAIVEFFGWPHRDIQVTRGKEEGGKK